MEITDPKAGAIQISIICPFYNEESIIVQATQRMLANLEKQLKNWELILVNDGSTDSSLDILLSSLDPDERRVRVLTSPINQGRGRALKNGINLAQGDIIVTTEVDCSWGDDIVFRLVKELEAHPETHFVIASPHLKKNGLVNVPWLRAFLTTFGNKLIRIFFVSNITMNTGMTRAYRREVIKHLAIKEDGKEFHLEVLLKLLTLNFKAREIPAVITWHDNKFNSGAKIRKSSTKILKTIISHLRFLAIAQPMRYFGAAAFIFFLFGAVFISLALYNLIVGITPAIYYAIVGLLSFIVSLLFTGFTVLFAQLREVMYELWLSRYSLLDQAGKANVTIVFPKK